MFSATNMLDVDHWSYYTLAVKFESVIDMEVIYFLQSLYK